MKNQNNEAKEILERFEKEERELEINKEISSSFPRGTIQGNFSPTIDKFDRQMEALNRFYTAAWILKDTYD